MSDANDKVPVNFVMKVYETKALAEEGDELNALYVFNNGIDGDTANPTVANGSQFISGTTNSSGAATNKLKGFFSGSITVISHHKFPRRKFRNMLQHLILKNNFHDRNSSSSSALGPVIRCVYITRIKKNR